MEGSGSLRDLLQDKGHMPLPPYIKRDPTVDDRTWYQTVFARRDGSIAAPTAGLHFTERLLTRLAASGVRLAWVTLHVGPGTFLPVHAPEIEQHRMLPEAFEIPAETAEAVRSTREGGRKVVAVGTTVVRTLETAGARDGTVSAGKGKTGPGISSAWWMASSRTFISPGRRC
jgi:S-adenosylmethionine:tRNA ribosyltransferase-isomerase